MDGPDMPPPERAPQAETCYLTRAMAKRRIIVLGAGGFAREVAWLIGDIGGDLEFKGFAVSDTAKLGPHDSEVLGDLDWLRSHKDRFEGLALGIGSPAARLRLPAELANDFGDDFWPALVHPSAHFDRKSCKVGPGVLLCANVIGTVNLSFEPFCMLNLSCTIGHEARIGRGSVLNPTVNVSGGVDIGQGVLVGTGAQILQYLTIGDGAIVGAGAVVTKDVPPGATVVGMPAKAK
jgi:sugar O-acyltransferase (sialic acid O-acetyltransferase NeuD family)